MEYGVAVFRPQVRVLSMCGGKQREASWLAIPLNRALASQNFIAALSEPQKEAILAVTVQE